LAHCSMQFVLPDGPQLEEIKQRDGEEGEKEGKKRKRECQSCLPILMNAIRRTKGK